MTAKRYFKRMWEEEYYIFDSNTISESDFEEKLEYQNYKAFEDSMMGDEVVNRLNEQHETIERLNQQLRIFSDGLKAEIRETKEVFEDYSECVDEKKQLKKENEQLKEELNKLKKFEYGGEHIRLSINIETGELQRHIYATGQWFGDFDRVLVDNWLSKEDYQRFINRVIEVYNTEFKKELKE